MHDSSCVFENKMHGYTKGAKGIYMALLHMEPPVIMNLKKIRRLMDKFNLSCPIRKANPYRRMAKALKTSAMSILIDRAAIRTSVLIADLFSITAIPLRVIAAQKSNNFNFPFIFLVIPFFHINPHSAAFGWRHK